MQRLTRGAKSTSRGTFRRQTTGEARENDMRVTLATLVAGAGLLGGATTESAVFFLLGASHGNPNPLE
jgi:hypothetical protein